jgi:hypothetical protein
MKKIKLKTLKIMSLMTFGFFAAAISMPDLIGEKVEAKPKFMKQYNADKYAKKEFQNNCTVCHIGKGGGENTYLGEDFAAANYRFTAELKAKYPTFFEQKLLNK